MLVKISLPRALAIAAAVALLITPSLAQTGTKKTTPASKPPTTKPTSRPPTTKPSPAPATAPAATSQPAPVLQNVRWQTLPLAIRSVVRTPDQRLWYSTATPSQVLGASNKTAINVAKAEIARQFKNNSPVLTLSMPALFEKSGAAWFILPDRATLLRYDGQSWVEMTPRRMDMQGNVFTGVCPDNGRLPSQIPNLAVGNICFFPQTGGIQAYDGNQWAFQAYPQPIDGFVSPHPCDCWLFAAPDQSAAFAVVAYPSTFFKYSNGKWDKLDLPSGIGKSGITSAACSADGTLWIESNAIGSFGDLRIVVLPGKASPAHKPSSVPVVLPGVDLAKIKAHVLSDSAGNIFISAFELDPTLAKTRTGFFVIEKSTTGKPRFIPDLLLYDPQYSPHLTSKSVPLIMNAGKTIYLSNPQGLDNPIFVDLAPDSPTTTPISDKSVCFIQAVASDDTIFLSNADPRSSSRESPPIVAYKPGAPDIRHTIKCLSFPAANFLITSDTKNDIWGFVENSGFCRLDGTKWTPVLPELIFPLGIIPGNDSLLVYDDKNFTLIQKTKNITGPQIDALIQENPAAFAAAFALPIDPANWLRTNNPARFAGPPLSTGKPYKGPWSIAADNRGRIYLAINATLRIFDQKWIDVPLPKDPHLSEDLNAPEIVIPLGDGSAMYVCNTINRTRTTPAHIVRLKNGTPQVLPAPSCENIMPLRDADGLLWVARSVHEDGDCIVDRLDHNGVKDTLTLPGLPLFLDKNGVAWLNGPQGYSLWQNNKIVGEIPTPAVPSVRSDKPGSVWIWNSAGLQHFVASDPAKPADYQRLYSIFVQNDGGTVYSGGNYTFALGKDAVAVTDSITVSQQGPGRLIKIFIRVVPLDKIPAPAP